MPGRLPVAHARAGVRAASCRGGAAARPPRPPRAGEHPPPRRTRRPTRGSPSERRPLRRARRRRSERARTDRPARRPTPQRPPVRSRPGAPGRGVPHRRVLLATSNRTRLTDHDHLHLTRILELVLDLARDLVREQGGAIVVDLGRLYDHADLTTRLQRVRLRHARLRRRDLLECGEPLDVVLETLTPGTGTRRRDRVRRDQEHRLDRLRLNLVVVRLDRVHDPVRFAVAPRQLRGDEGVRAVDLVGHRLADVVQERGTLRSLHTRAELRRHDSREVDDFERVLEHVLPVARPVPKAAEDHHELLVELAAVRLEHGLRPGLVHLLVELGFRLVVHLLDPGRVDPPVLDQLLERELRDLAADAVERREHDGVRGVVDDHIHPGQVLERADVPAFAADDAALHVVARKLDHGHGRLRGVTRCDALERIRHQRPRPPACLAAGLLFHLPHRAGELVPDEVLRALEHCRLRLSLRHPGDALELADRTLPARLLLVLELLEMHLAIADALLAPRDLDQLLVDLRFALRDPLLDLRDLELTVANLALDVGAQLDGALARLDK